MNRRARKNGMARVLAFSILLPPMVAGPAWAGNGPSRIPARAGTSADPQRPVNPGRAGRSVRASGVTPWLWPGFLLFLAAGGGSPLAGFGQVQDFRPAEGPFDLSGTHPAATEGVHLALTRANRTSTLPPLEELNEYMASHSPGGVSPLASLPPLPIPNPLGPSSSVAAAPANLPQLPRSVASPPPLPARGTQPAAAPDHAHERQPLLTTLRAARLIQTQATLLSIAYQLLAISTIQTEHPEISLALRIVAMELQSTAFAFGAEASHTQALEAERQITVLDNRRARAGEAGLFLEPDPEAGFFSTQAAAAELPRFMNSEIVYGTWQRLENVRSGQRILYRISPKAFTKFSAITDDHGDQEITSEHHPGVVTSTLSYRVPGPGAAPAKAKEGIKIKLLIEQVDGPPLAMSFLFLRAMGGSGDAFLDVLVEAEGEQRAFVRLSAAPGLARGLPPGAGLLSYTAVGQEFLEP